LHPILGIILPKNPNFGGREKAFSSGGGGHLEKLKNLNIFATD